MIENMIIRAIIRMPNNFHRYISILFSLFSRRIAGFQLTFYLEIVYPKLILFSNQTWHFLLMKQAFLGDNLIAYSEIFFIFKCNRLRFQNHLWFLIIYQCNACISVYRCYAIEVFTAWLALNNVSIIYCVA